MNPILLQLAFIYYLGTVVQIWMKLLSAVLKQVHLELKLLKTGSETNLYQITNWEYLKNF